MTKTLEAESIFVRLRSFLISMGDPFYAERAGVLLNVWWQNPEDPAIRRLLRQIRLVRQWRSVVAQRCTYVWN